MGTDGYAAPEYVATGNLLQASYCPSVEPVMGFLCWDPFGLGQIELMDYLGQS